MEVVHACRWARTICGRFNFPVRDLKGSFADGRALCYLVRKVLL